MLSWPGRPRWLQWSFQGYRLRVAPHVVLYTPHRDHNRHRYLVHRASLRVLRYGQDVDWDHGHGRGQDQPCDETGTATVTWATKKTSTESYKFTELTGSKNLCPGRTGYSKVAEAKETGSVTGGTAKAMKGGAVTATACAYFKGSNHSTIYIFNDGPVKM